MKKLLLAIVFSIASILLNAVEQKLLSEKEPETLTNVRILGKTNKSPLSYLPGEEIVFTFTLGVFISVKGGMDSKFKTGKLLLTNH